MLCTLTAGTNTILPSKLFLRCSVCVSLLMLKRNRISFTLCSYAQAINQFQGLRTLAYDVSVGECLCPLCKTLVNTLVPINEVSAVDATSHSFHDLSVSIIDMKLSAQKMCLEGQKSMIRSNSSVLSSLDRRFFDTCLSMRHRLTTVANITEEKYLQNVLGVEERAVLNNVGVKCSRVFHSITSAAATTFLSLSHQYLINSGDIAAIKDSDKSLCAQLIQLIMRYPRTTMAEQVRSERVLTYLTYDFVESLFPIADRKESTLVANMDLDRVILSLPYHVVSDSLYPSDTTIYKVLRAHEKYYQDSVPTLWGHLKTPLLTMDLAHMVINFTGMAGDFCTFISFLPVFVLAKIAQVLLDPAVAVLGVARNAPTSPVHSSAVQKGSEGKIFKRSKLEHSRSEQHEFVSILESLRAILAERAGVTMHRRLSPDHVVYILDSVVPFVHFLAVITVAMTNFDREIDYESLLLVTEEEMDMNGFIAFTNAFFGKVHVPYNLQQLLQSTLAGNLCAAWAESLRLHYQPQQQAR
ncbi:hypothetical protein EON65_20585 [archaeon]|nr:MAG: hypothetical protein EON65_20585 [archaeon]